MLKLLILHSPSTLNGQTDQAEFIMPSGFLEDIK